MIRSTALLGIAFALVLATACNRNNDVPPGDVLPAGQCDPTPFLVTALVPPPRHCRYATSRPGTVTAHARTTRPR